MATSTTATPTPSPTNTGGGGGGGGDGGSSSSKPLLFFVALGFGVVFTNLWIIVGVKYCFRYNQRARAAQLAEENGEIDMQNMHRTRPRRQKKLMSMDQVNEKFPLTKYKIWRATREQEGLPAAGGVTANPSRAPSIRESVAIIRQSVDNQTHGGDKSAMDASAERDSHDKSRSSTEAASKKSTDATVDVTEVPETPQVEDFAGPTTAKDDKKKGNAIHTENVTISVEGSDSDHATKNPATVSTTQLDTSQPKVADDEEEDPIRDSVTNELLAQPGDACAICIETLEDDDEVRGLTCGHAFHAGCVDPWLTSRRACCPLCKADYYVPKNRHQHDSSTDSNQNGDATATAEAGMNEPQNPQHNPVYTQSTREPFRPTPHAPRIYNVIRENNYWRRQMRDSNNQRRQQSNAERANTTQTQTQSSPSRFTSWVRTMPQNMPWSRSRNNNLSQEETASRTPRQLESQS